MVRVFKFEQGIQVRVKADNHLTLGSVLEVHGHGPIRILYLER